MRNAKNKIAVINLKNWIKKNQLEFISLVLIVLVAGILRLYKIDGYMTFLGDEGRDVRVVRKLILEFDPVLIGPMTSVTTSAGHMYLGPLYYYLMSPFLILSGLSPVGPAVMVALFSLGTVVLMWWLGRKWFDPTVGLVAGGLYAISPTVITYSRSSWNPNIMPFFALLSVWAIYEIYLHSHIKGNKLRTVGWFVTLGVSIAFVLQSHYLGLILIPVLGLFWLISLINYYKLNIKYCKKFIKYSLYSLGFFLFLMSPLLIFDLRHNWMNLNALKAFFTERQTTVNLKFYKDFSEMYPILKQIYSSLLTIKNEFWAETIIWITGLMVIANLMGIGGNFLDKKNKNIFAKMQKVNPALVLLLIWLFVGILGLAVYKQHIYDHYFGFLFPVPFLLTGWVVWQISLSFSSLNFPRQIKKQKLIDIGDLGFKLLIVLLVVSPLVYINIKANPLKQFPNRQLAKTEEISRTIIEASNGEPFNLALISKSNYDEGYRYFMEWWKAPLVKIDPLNAKTTITGQLFVICENQPPYKERDADCNPIAHPKSEIALFGWAKIDQEWIFPWGHKLYRLVRYQPKKVLTSDI